MSKDLSVFKGKTTLATRNVQVGRGSQNVGADDVAIPRLKLLQLISKEVQPAEAQFIEGAQAGMFLNSVTNELYTSLFVVNLHFKRSFVAWKKRKMGGGMFGSFATEEEAVDALIAAKEPVGNYDIGLNPTHLLMILTDEGKPDGIALFDMPASKVKKSKMWNTNIAKHEDAGNPRFGCVWELNSTSETGAEGAYSNVEAKFIVNAPNEVFEAAEAAYNTYFGADEAASISDEDIDIEQAA